eukprot:IDg22887t1
MGGVSTVFNNRTLRDRLFLNSRTATGCDSRTRLGVRLRQRAPEAVGLSQQPLPAAGVKPTVKSRLRDSESRSLCPQHRPPYQIRRGNVGLQCPRRARPLSLYVRTPSGSQACPRWLHYSPLYVPRAFLRFIHTGREPVIALLPGRQIANLTLVSILGSGFDNTIGRTEAQCTSSEC